MKYLTAIPVFALLLVFDLALGATLILAITANGWPYAPEFARRVWFA